MSKLNPIERSQYIYEQYKEYLKSSFYFGDEELQRLYEDELEYQKLFKGPYVALDLPFQRGATLNDLIEEGIVCSSFRKLGNIDFDRPLYMHQEQSLRLIGSGHSAVITTGTGSGKTECFLFPILNELLHEVELGNRDIGIRAIFLYPMNALVNDQIDRVRKMLENCPDITFGFFTGDTPETISKNFRDKYREENGVSLPLNELVSREEIRANPPHLLFTNYSMLEYLLIRPNDYALFKPERLNNWKYVVLDEAHTYTGSLGIELSMLMRRLTGMAKEKPKFILTSATLGKQGESEKEIVEFARKMTSAKFEISDIIYSSRIQLRRELVSYRIDGQVYIDLKQNLNNISNMKRVANSYLKGDFEQASILLYELLSRDSNVFELYKCLKDCSEDYHTILDTALPHLTDTQLSALIDLINAAEKNGIGLFELKYHSFIRPLAGAYIAFGKSPKLSLTKTNYINGRKAFELGNCRYCSTPYIIGKVCRNPMDQLNYLFQNKEVDIYENYGENEHVQLDYFIMGSSICEESDVSTTEEYILCGKCGAIFEAKNLNALQCQCGKKYQIHVFKVIEKQEKKGDFPSSNNIHQCPYCGRKNRGGIVKNLNLGKESGTAVTAQILLESLEDNDSDKKTVSTISLKPRSRRSAKDKSPDKVKQFLSFSDSRQQASFAAAFFDMEHIRMLYKRIIWKLIERNQYQVLSFEEIAAELTHYIKERDLFDNSLDAHKNAWIALLVDLLKVDGSFDGEGLGLYYFALDLDEIMSQLDDEAVEETFGEYNLNKSDLETLIQVVFSIFKTTPAINYTKSTLSPEEKTKFLGYRRFDNYIMFQSSKALKNIRSFLPVSSDENRIVRYVKNVCNCDSDEAKQILEILFYNIGIEGGIFQKHATKDAYQINTNQFVLKNYKKSKYYCCSKCGRVTPFNIHNVCPEDRCSGVLKETDPDVYFARNYFRRQYLHKKIEKIVVKEHTAQLSRKQARDYQNAFKSKKINILSCSTTFEMGVDIGDLETVFMRNVPPTPANSVQRAGRAGRRKDSSAYILTYCGIGSHDYTYFLHPEKMISGVIRPPHFNVLNKKIILRHLVAASLGFFFRENPSFFKNIDSFVFHDGANQFRKYLKLHPQNLCEYIDTQVIPEKIYSAYHDFRWYDEMEEKDEQLNYFEELFRQTLKEYEKAKDDAVSSEQYSAAAYFTGLISNLRKMRVIDSLSKYCVIPKYGFPVDVVPLQIYENGILNNKYDLDRDLRVAISEYAPSSEIIVDGKKYTSQYITLPKSGELAKNYFCHCPACGKVNVYISNRNSGKCKYCEHDIDTAVSEFFIEPIYGFKTGITKESTQKKPKRSYAGEISYLGGGIKDDEKLLLNDAIMIETSSNDELLVMNRSDFYMCSCPTCGYSEIAPKGNITPFRVKEHKNYRQFTCTNDRLDRMKIAHRFQTDVARFTIPSIKAVSGVDYAKALSFLYAFLEGISIIFNIERNDIDGIIEHNTHMQCYDILLFDNVPGGAGHVKRLMDRESIISALRAALDKVSQECCDENTSCYNCLRNYYNQSYHEKLRRNYAIEVLEMLLQKIE